MLLTPSLTAITLDVADLKFDETTLRQRASISELTITFLPDGCCELLLIMPRSAYGIKEDGTTGEPVPSTYLTLQPVRLRGDRNVAVDPKDGFPRYRLHTPLTALNTLTQLIETFEPGQTWEQFLEAKPDAYMLQDRYFGQMCQSGQVNINAMLSLYGAQADATPSLFAVEQPVPHYAPVVITTPPAESPTFPPPSPAL
jgi:hypothetical protein